MCSPSDRWDSCFFRGVCTSDVLMDAGEMSGVSSRYCNEADPLDGGVYELALEAECGLGTRRSVETRCISPLITTICDMRLSKTSRGSC